ncbi:MAG: hypothetical protein Q9163_004000 [Psora crenata]
MGAILIRVASFRGLVWVHAAMQFNGHPIIGTVVIACLYLQPLLGLLNHHLYKKEGNPTIWTTLHIWWGRIIVTLGIINGGLGLMLSDNTRNGEIAYGVIAGIIWLVWMGIAAWSHFTGRGSSGRQTGENMSRKGTHENRTAMGNVESIGRT